MFGFLYKNSVVTKTNEYLGENGPDRLREGENPSVSHRLDVMTRNYGEQVNKLAGNEMRFSAAPEAPKAAEVPRISNKEDLRFDTAPGHAEAPHPEPGHPETPHPTPEHQTPHANAEHSGNQSPSQESRMEKWIAKPARKYITITSPAIAAWGSYHLAPAFWHSVKSGVVSFIQGFPPLKALATQIGSWSPYFGLNGVATGGVIAGGAMASLWGLGKARNWLLRRDNFVGRYMRAWMGFKDKPPEKTGLFANMGEGIRTIFRLPYAATIGAGAVLWEAAKDITKIPSLIAKHKGLVLGATVGAVAAPVAISGLIAGGAVGLGIQNALKDDGKSSGGGDAHGHGH